MDPSNGYEQIASKFILHREHAANAIGASTVRKWAQSLPHRSHVLDLGCGTGIPISKVLMDEGLTVYGIDASPTLLNTFQQNFPNVPAVCEAVEESPFFNRQFDAIVAWGLIFLLSEEAQKKVILKSAHALNTGGKFLFTAPLQETEWKDIMTGHVSQSMGKEKYLEILSASGFGLVDTFEDEGGNHYFSTVKI